MHWLPYSAHISHHPSQTQCLPGISYATQKLMLDLCSLNHSISFCGIFSIAYRSFKLSSRPDCIFEIPQLWQSGFSRVYYNCCCSCSFEPEIIKIGQLYYQMYSNNIVNFQGSTTILNCRTKSLETYWRPYIYTLCRTASTDIPDPLSPHLPIIHRLRQVFRSTSCIHT